MFLFEITVDCWVYTFPTLLFCSAFKSKHTQLFPEVQSSLDLEVTNQESV